MEKFSLLRFLNEGDRHMLCMMCKRYDCKNQTCPGDENELYVQTYGYNCPYFQSPSTPISDDLAHEIMCDIFAACEANREERRSYMEKIMVEIIKQCGYKKTAKMFEDQAFDVPFETR